MKNNKTQWRQIAIGAGLGVLFVRAWLRRRPRRAHPDGAAGIAAIIGASSGIGAEFARQLAAQGYSLLLVGRRADRLAQIATDLEEQYGTATEIFVADLAQPAEVAALEKRLGELETLAFLVNNAGFGTGGARFATGDLAPLMDMIQVHDIATVRLTRAVLPGMIAHRHGAVISVSSLAALIPVGGNAIYAASKAFLNAFSQALHVELMGTGVRVQALCPGFTHTDFHDRPAYKNRQAKSRIPDLLWLSARQVVSESLAALAQDEVVVVPGWHYRLGVAVARSGLVMPLVGMVTRRLRGLPAETKVKNQK